MTADQLLADAQTLLVALAAERADATACARHAARLGDDARRLRAALAWYGEHAPDCQARGGVRVEGERVACACGLLAFTGEQPPADARTLRRQVETAHALVLHGRELRKALADENARLHATLTDTRQRLDHAEELDRDRQERIRALVLEGDRLRESRDRARADDRVARDEVLRLRAALEYVVGLRAHDNADCTCRACCAATMASRALAGKESER